MNLPLKTIDKTFVDKATGKTINYKSFVLTIKTLDGTKDIELSPTFKRDKYALLDYLRYLEKGGK